MADQRLRQRGWSIQSSDDPPSNRARAESSATTATEPSLSHDEKVALMNSAFDDVHNDDVEIVIPSGKKGKLNQNDESDYVAMFGEEESCEGGDEKDEVPTNHRKKRRKLKSTRENTADSSDSSEDESGSDNSNVETGRQKIELTQFQQEKLDLAKSKLSKWAARLFDPNRPRGLVEPPKT
jgi:hypothetical protein